MRLTQLLEAAEQPAPPDLPDAEVQGVADDSRLVVPGSVFVAVAGTRADGRAYAADAAARGAVAIVAASPRPDDAPAAIPWIEVVDARRSLARLAAAVHGFPARGLVVTGVTGSKGKTTTSFLVAAVAEAAGERSALLGTVVYRTGLFEHPAPLTTPAATDVHALLAEAARARCAGAVIEVSSHALDQHRVHSIPFAFGVFTNLFPDHLDYHPTVDAYFEAKRRLFVGEDAAEHAVIGIDGRHGQRLAADCPGAVTFGASAEADVRPLSVEVSRSGTRVLAQIPGGSQVLLDSPLLGRFNAPNLLAAAAWGVARGFDPEVIRAGVRSLERVPGRMDPVDLGQPFTCLVDYSHTGPALDAALAAAREWTSGRVIVVVGAGGNRDRARRRELGEAAARLADEAILTSDNPREEDPLAILDAMERAWRAAGGSMGAVLPDRAEAIARAVSLAKPGDTLIVAGKGHETMQIVGRERRPFDDRHVLSDALRARGYGA